MVRDTQQPGPVLDSRLRGVLLVGDYGCGKTEVAVNLALGLARQRGKGTVAIADCDLVNPYFRCREAAEPLEQAGIHVVVPGGGHRFADLPILLPGVKGLLQQTERFALLDVGGDEVGARVLAALAPAFDPAKHGLWFVVNANRPFTDSVDGCVQTIRRIEAATGIPVTGLVSNTHLMTETTAEMVSDGVELTAEVARSLDLPLQLVAVMDGLQDLEIDKQHPLLVMQRLMVPPWVRRAEPAGADAQLGPGQFKPGPL